MFDLRRPPRNHTYHDTFVNQTLETVLSARVPQAMVILPGPQVLPLAPLPTPCLPKAMVITSPRAPSQLIYLLLWSDLSAPASAPGIPKLSPASHLSPLNHRSFGYQMKIGPMSNNGHPGCARYMDSREATELRGPSFLTSPTKTCHCWISSECQGKGAKGIP